MSGRIRVGIDQGVNVKALRRLQSQGLIELHQANELEQPFPKVIQDKKGFMVGDTRLGRDVLAKEDVAHALGRIIGPGNRRDIGHMYAAYVNKCDDFVTEDVKDFINNGRREALESLLGVKIRRTIEFIQEIGT